MLVFPSSWRNEVVTISTMSEKTRSFHKSPLSNPSSVKPSDSTNDASVSHQQVTRVYVRRNNSNNNKRAKGITTTKLQQNHHLPPTQTHKVTTFFCFVSQSLYLTFPFALLQ